MDKQLVDVSTLPAQLSQDNLNYKLKTKPSICPTCHQFVKEIDYFCSNCGANLKPAPPSTTITSQLILYIKSIAFPPLGFVWGFKYLRQPDTKSKIIGLTAMVITVILLVIIITTTVSIINTVNEQVNQQFNQMLF